jgi:hypothetical protein
MFNPKLFKIIQSGRKPRQKQGDDPKFLKGLRAFRDAISTSVPEELSVDELTSRIGDVLFQIIREIRTLSSDLERSVSVLAQQSSVPDLKNVLLKCTKVLQAFTIPPLTSEDFEGHPIGKPNIPELLQAIRKVNIVLPGIGAAEKYLCSHHNDLPIADRVGAASPATSSSETISNIQAGIGIFISIGLLILSTLVERGFPISTMKFWRLELKDV